MKLSILAPLMALALTAAAGCSKPDQPVNTARTGQPGTTYDADNTGKNARDRGAAAVTPLDQKENEADRGITQQLRKAVVADDALSLQAHNVKIITSDGVVTLRGPVKSEAERTSIVSKAKQVTGVKRIDNQLELEKN